MASASIPAINSYLIQSAKSVILTYQQGLRITSHDQQFIKFVLDC